jgi:Flp pilus assembly protein TadG
LFRSNGGAVAPTVALSLFGLIAAGGIAFDYARLASMDTELQNAADQAALAAAGQLDGQDGACARAAAAASALLSNQTLFANDAEGTAVAIQNEPECVNTGADDEPIRFYKSWDQLTDTPGDPATDDTDAKVVVVSVNPREAFYALTPIAAVFSSGGIGAEAVATLASSLCKVPPVMICNPDEATSTSFDASAYIGDGLRLTTVGQGGGWVPGNFGYLDSFGGTGGADGLRQAIGWDVAPGTCLPGSGVTTKPGANVSVTDALNTRFDIYDTQGCPAGGTCSPAFNNVKDVRRPANANGANACKIHPNQGWQPPGSDYYGFSLPTSDSVPLTTTEAQNLSAMGHPRDMCHAVSEAGTCANDRIGDGVWDADAYFWKNYVRTEDGSGGAAGTRWSSTHWRTNTGLSTTVARTVPGPNPGDPNVLNPAYASRYNVYLWEIANAGDVVDGVTVLAPSPAGATGSDPVSYGEAQCGTPTASIPDRRVITSAVVNCTANGVSGSSSDVPVEKWIKIFLVEPSLDRARTHAGDIYVEIVGESTAGGDELVRHDVPYLIK